MIQELASGRKFSGFRRQRTATKKGVPAISKRGRIINRDLGEKESDVLKTATDGPPAAVRGFQGASPRSEAGDRSRPVSDRRNSVGRNLQAPAQRGGNLREGAALAERAGRRASRGYGTPAAASLATISGSHPYDRLDPDMAWDDVDAKRRKGIVADIRRKNADLTQAVWQMEGSHRNERVRLSSWTGLSCGKTRRQLVVISTWGCCGVG
jgi:hypothetical protein